MNDILEGLTAAQCEAVTHKDGPMLVLAGAGSGKTRVVTRRIAYLLSHGVWPSQILAMTFTNKAAREMQERIAALINGEAPRNIGTFHGCCARFLRHDIELLNDGRNRNFTIYDDGEQLTVIKRVLKNMGQPHPSGLSPSGVQELINNAKAQRVEADVLALRQNYNEPELLGLVAKNYEAEMCRSNAVDFEDLLALMVKILEEHQEVRELYHNRFRYLLIDEYQDTNRLQYELMRLLAGPAENVHVTGDPDQSIYSWRGADYSNIMNFTRDFPTAKVVKLEQNYRSTQSILDVANALIRHNGNRMEKNLFTENGEGCPVRDVFVYSGQQEAEWLSQRILQLRSEGISLRDIAVFYRTNSQSRLLEDSLRRMTIPYCMPRGTKFYDRMEIKDLLAFLRLHENHCDLISLERVAKCVGDGIGPRTLAKLVQVANDVPIPVLDLLAADDLPQLYGKLSSKLREFADKCRKLRQLPNAPLGDAVQGILEFSRLEDTYILEEDGQDRIDNLREMVAEARQFEQDFPDATLEEYLENVALVADVELRDETADRCSLMTLHSAKGLEFPYVFIAGVEQGYLPHVNSMEDPEGLEEERRLLYVGITRAKEELTLLHAQTRFLWQGLTVREPSCFLEELPKNLVQHLTYGIRKGYR